VQITDGAGTLQNVLVNFSGLTSVGAPTLPAPTATESGGTAAPVKTTEPDVFGTLGSSDPGVGGAFNFYDANGVAHSVGVTLTNTGGGVWTYAITGLDNVTAGGTWTGTAGGELTGTLTFVAGVLTNINGFGAAYKPTVTASTAGGPESFLLDFTALSEGASSMPSGSVDGVDGGSTSATVSGQLDSLTPSAYSTSTPNNTKTFNLNAYDGAGNLHSI